MSTGLLKNHLLFEGHLHLFISSHSPQKTFTYFEKYRLKKSSKYCIMIISKFFHCNLYRFRLSFLWLICFHRFFVFLFSFQLFKIILGLQHKIVALAPGRKSLLLFTLKSFGCLPLELELNRFEHFEQFICARKWEPLDFLHRKSDFLISFFVK